MSLISEIQRCAWIVPDYVAASAILFAAAATTLVSGLLRGRAATRQWLPGVAFGALGTAAMWPLSTGMVDPWLRGIALGAAAVALLVHTLISAGDQQGSAGNHRVEPVVSRSYLTVLILAAGVFLFYNLGGYSGPALLPWEATVTFRFGEAFIGGESVTHFTLQRFLWDDGVLSAGNTSLFYGAPTYALFHTVGFSPWTLRCAAVVATLLSIGVAYVVGQRFFGPLVAAAVAAAFALNPCVLFYARYGSSPAGTLLALLLALLTTWLFLDAKTSALWYATLCSAMLYLATLQYSPARIVVLLLLAFIPIGLAYQRREVGRQRIASLAAIAVMALVVWRVESSFHRQGFFLHARGETFFALLQNPEYVHSLYGGDPLPPHIRPDALSLSAKIELLGRALRVTFPQYLKLMLPALTPPQRGAVLISDPPALPMYFGPMFIFIVWGAAHSLRAWRSWPRICLLLWVVLGTGPLLLTNRVDAHRIMLFVIPLSFFTALGICEAARVMRRAGVPQAVQHAFAVALALCAAYSALNLLNYEHPPQPPAGRAIAAEAASVQGPVMVGVEGMQREVGWAYLQMLERMRQEPRRPVRLLDDRLVHAVRSEVGEPPESYVNELHRLSTNATVLLAPADDFRRLGAALERKGARVIERGLPEFHVLRAEAGTKAAGMRGEKIAVLPTPVFRASSTPPPPAHLREGPQRMLTELRPMAVTFGFQPPKVDHNWDGGPLRMGGVTYEHGLGTHAWSRMTYAVPDDSIAFQAIVGLSDGVRECEKAAVTFEVRGDQDRLLYDSGLVDTTTPPQAIYVTLGDSRTLTLVVTEGGNGRDCDHALWALPAFLARSK